MHFVMARASGDWVTCFEARSEAPTSNPIVYLVMALEGGAGAPRMWNVNGDGIEVERGLVVGFRNLDDAKHFLDTPRGREPRACRVSVVAGDIVAFHDLAHAQWFMTLEQADYVTEEQVAQIVAQRQAGDANVDASPDQSSAPDDGADAAASEVPAQKRGRKRGN